MLGRDKGSGPTDDFPVPPSPRDRDEKYARLDSW